MKNLNFTSYWWGNILSYDLEIKYTFNPKQFWEGPAFLIAVIMTSLFLMWTLN